jgi:leader peptidase (prepilin peptidase)/N-methyltransferase
MTSVLVLAGLLGACLGSFANVLIYRLPRNLSPARGRSQCPACGHLIAWYDNVPLLSWLVLRGRCRHCHSPIAARYPLVELVSASLAVLVVSRLSLGWSAAAAFGFLYLLGVIAVIDWQHMVIPHTLSLGGMILGLALAPVTGLGLASSLLGLAVGFAAVMILSRGYQLVRGQAGMGDGDAMLMGMVGAFVGPWGAAGVLGTGALLGTVYAVGRGGGRLARDAKLPFGTFLAAAGAIVFWAGPAIWQWYTHLVA